MKKMKKASVLILALLLILMAVPVYADTAAPAAKDPAAASTGVKTDAAKAVDASKTATPAAMDTAKTATPAAMDTAKTATPAAMDTAKTATPAAVKDSAGTEQPMDQTHPITNTKEAREITVTVDGTKVTFDQPPAIKDGRTLVPMRAIFEALGAVVSWDDQDKLVTADKRFDHISLKIGSSDMQVNDKTVKLDVPAEIMNGRTLVPARAVAEALGADVKWDDAAKTVTITSKQGAHHITDQYATTQVKDDKGKAILDGRAAYPVIANPDKNSAIDSLNAAFAKTANDYIESLKGDPTTQAKKDHASNAGISASLSYEYIMAFDITYDQGNLVSMNVSKMSSTGGAHPSTEMSSAVYDLSTGKTLALTDILKGTQKEIDQKIIDGFNAMIDKDSAAYLKDAKDTVTKDISKVQFYLGSDAIHFYFQQDTIAPYAAGFVEYTIPYADKDLFQLTDLAGK